MSSPKNSEFVIDEDELCAYIASKGRIDLEIVECVLDVEMAFMERKGMVAKDNEKLPDEKAQTTIDSNELVDFIVSRTHIDRNIVSKVLEIELQYLSK